MIGIGAFGGGLAGVWAVAYLVGVVLPTGWIQQWYGFPMLVTCVFGVIAAVVGGAYVGSILEDA